MGPARKVVRKLGGFALVRELGQGAMGKVFLARQESLDRLVALKILRPELAKDREFLARFQREARAAAVFQHPNVVAVLNAGTDDGVHFIAFEFVDGGSLEDMLQDRRKIPELEALSVCRGVAQALCYAESKGLVHRDVKPENILLAPGRVPKLADLGLAKRPLEDKQLTATGVVLGTPLYMAPEQACGVKDLDIRADIYALGLCLWRMLSGLMPFDEDGRATSLQILSRHVNEDLIDVRERNPAISADAARLVRGMSARQREERYQSAAQLARDIDRVLAGQPSEGPTPPEGAKATVALGGEDVQEQVAAQRARARMSGRSPRPARRQGISPRTALAVAGLALFAGVLLAVAYATNPPADPPRPPEPTPAAPTATPAVEPTASPGAEVGLGSGPRAWSLAMQRNLTEADPVRRRARIGALVRELERSGRPGAIAQTQLLLTAALLADSWPETPVPLRERALRALDARQPNWEGLRRGRRGRALAQELSELDHVLGKLRAGMTLPEALVSARSAGGPASTFLTARLTGQEPPLLDSPPAWGIVLFLGGPLPPEGGIDIQVGQAQLSLTREQVEVAGSQRLACDPQDWGRRPALYLEPRGAKLRLHAVERDEQRQLFLQELEAGCFLGWSASFSVRPRAGTPLESIFLARVFRPARDGDTPFLADWLEQLGERD